MPTAIPFIKIKPLGVGLVVILVIVLGWIKYIGLGDPRGNSAFSKGELVVLDQLLFAVFSGGHLSWGQVENFTAVLTAPVAELAVTIHWSIL